ncbi:hypothetical protein VaNZ11_004390 [Volvox africanus]|uniref:Membrane-associated protein n=1 Tax=Volvox africanus TaxID=51714 RepID=A0ABQ5RXG0_9CHLO|nr:hypothetical protein VaNZ11_004390 [Volvox africanus]
MALQLRIAILMTILATYWQLSSTLATSVQTDQQKVLVLAAQQQQSQWQSRAAASVKNDNNNNGHINILMKKTRQTIEWLLNWRVSPYVAHPLCSLLVTPIMTIELLQNSHQVPLETTTPNLDQILIAASSGFLTSVACFIALPFSLMPFLRVCTSLWAKSCIYIIALSSASALLVALISFNKRWCVVVASGPNPPAVEGPRLHRIKTTIRPAVKLDDDIRAFVQHTTFDCMNVRADVYDYCSDQRIKMWGEERLHYHSHSLAVEMTTFGGYRLVQAETQPCVRILP